MKGRLSFYLERSAGPLSSPYGGEGEIEAPLGCGSLGPRRGHRRHRRPSFPPFVVIPFLQVSQYPLFLIFPRSMGPGGSPGDAFSPFPFCPDTGSRLFLWLSGPPFFFGGPWTFFFFRFGDFLFFRFEDGLAPFFFFLRGKRKEGLLRMRASLFFFFLSPGYFFEIREGQLRPPFPFSQMLHACGSRQQVFFSVHPAWGGLPPLRSFPFPGHPAPPIFPPLN